MSQDEKQNSELNDLKTFEAQLGSLLPRTDRTARDRLMFALGQASVQPARRRAGAARWAWPMATAAMGVVAASLAVILLVRPAGLGVQQLAAQPGPAPAELASHVPVPASAIAEAAPEHGSAPRVQEPQRPGADAEPALAWFLPRSGGRSTIAPYLRLRQESLAQGLDSCPTGSAPPGEGATSPSDPVSYGQWLHAVLPEG